METTVGMLTVFYPCLWEMFLLVFRLDYSLAIQLLLLQYSFVCVCVWNRARMISCTWDNSTFNYFISDYLKNFPIVNKLPRKLLINWTFKYWINWIYTKHDLVVVLQQKLYVHAFSRPLPKVPEKHTVRASWLHVSPGSSRTASETCEECEYSSLCMSIVTDPVGNTTNQPYNQSWRSWKSCYNTKDCIFLWPTTTLLLHFVNMRFKNSATQ